MVNFEDMNENYSSPLLDELLNQITPAEQELIDYKMKLAAKIYAGLKAKGWKSLDLARALNLKSPSLVSRWLSGTHNFTIDTLVDIQRLLGIRLLDVEPAMPVRGLHTNFTVDVAPVSLREEVYGPLQKVINGTGGVQAAALAADR
ncbi:helix-turn-helix transcriptional regulator [Chitinophaga sp.]|uniref:helix-turn-helix domain-containing protein n=1 Tax=Chitinophaga sp. TaxID=1869181 RepID=UPI0031D23CDB